MTKFVSIIGNGESRRGFDITPLKQFTTVVGCNAIFRDHNLEYIVACDRHMCQEAANTCGKVTVISAATARNITSFNIFGNLAS